MTIGFDHSTTIQRKYGFFWDFFDCVSENVQHQFFFRCRRNKMSIETHEYFDVNGVNKRYERSIRLNIWRARCFDDEVLCLKLKRKNGEDRIDTEEREKKAHRIASRLELYCEFDIMQTKNKAHHQRNGALQPKTQHQTIRSLSNHQPTTK